MGICQVNTDIKAVLIKVDHIEVEGLPVIDRPLVLQDVRVFHSYHVDRSLDQLHEHEGEDKEGDHSTHFGSVFTMSFEVD